MVHKGQSAVELTLVIGLAVVLSSPFIISSQSAVLQLNQASQILNLETSLDKIEDKSQNLAESSYPARRLVTVETPRDVEAVYNPTSDNRSALVYSVESGGRSTNHSIIFDTVFSIDNKSEISQEGIHKISIKKTKEGLNASVVEK